MKISTRMRRGVVVAGAVAGLAVIGAGVASADPAPAPYQATSATVSVPHKMLAPDVYVPLSCQTGWHVDGSLTSGGMWVPVLDVHGKWIYNDSAVGSNQVGTIPGKPGYWPVPEYQTVTVGLHNASFISDHDGSYTVTCTPNV